MPTTQILTILLAAGLACAAGSATTARVPTSLSKGLVFYAPFEDTSKAAFANGVRRSSTDSPDFAEGKVGRGLRIAGDKPTPAYDCEGNLGRTSGTIMFWFKPAWDLSEPKAGVTRFFMGGGAQSDPLFFMAWNGSNTVIQFSNFTGDGWVWEPYVKASDVKADVWHHMAFVWTAKEKAIYLDGVERVRCQTKWLGYVWGGKFRVGSHANGESPAEGVYDDLAIWDRALAPSEIKSIYESYRVGSDPMAAIVPGPDASERKPDLLFKGSFRGRPDFLLDSGEPTSVEVEIKNVSAADQRGDAIYELFDYHNKSISRFRKRVQVPAGKTVLDTIALKPGGSGVFKLVVSSASVTQDVIVFGALPKRTDECDQSSHFGAHTPLEPRYLDLAKRIGVKWIRLHDFGLQTWWTSVEKQKGQFTFDDAPVSDAVKRGFSILGVLEATPSWASSAPAGTREDDFYAHRAYPARDIKDWENYVAATVGHFKDRIKYWEVWNEADVNSFWTGAPEQYAGYVRVAYEAAKRADPDCIIMGGGAIPLQSKAWLERVLKAGALDYLDKLVFHGYAEGDDFLLSKPADYKRKGSGFANEKYDYRINYISDLMKSYGKTRPMWDTETTVFGRTFYSSFADNDELPPPRLWVKETPAIAASELVKLYTVNLAHGVDKIFFYYMKNVTFRNTWHYHQSLVEADGAPTSRLIAYANLSGLIGCAKFIGQAGRADGISCYVFEPKMGNTSLAVVWSKRKATLDFKADPKALSVVDLMGNARPLDARRLRIDDEPVFIRARMPARKLLALLKL